MSFQPLWCNNYITFFSQFLTALAQFLNDSWSRQNNMWNSWHFVTCAQQKVFLVFAHLGKRLITVVYSLNNYWLYMSLWSKIMIFFLNWMVLLSKMLELCHCVSHHMQYSLSNFQNLLSPCFINCIDMEFVARWNLNIFDQPMACAVQLACRCKSWVWVL